MFTFFWSFCTVQIGGMTSVFLSLSIFRLQNTSVDDKCASTLCRVMFANIRKRQKHSERQTSVGHHALYLYFCLVFSASLRYVRPAISDKRARAVARGGATSLNARARKRVVWPATYAVSYAGRQLRNRQQRRSYI